MSAAGRLYRSLTICLGCLFAAVAASAATFPDKPVQLVVGFAAGSVSDIVARLVAQKLEAALGKPFVVEVRPGAGSNVAAQYVVRSAKDGYTLFVTTSSSTIRSPTAGFDFGTDLAPVALISSVPFVLAAYPGLGAKTVRDFVVLAKSKPRELTFGGSGVGTTGYLVAQLFNQRAGTELAIAPYPSTVQATTDLMTGRISAAFASVPNVIQLIETGKLTALAMAQPTRSALLPDTPTIDEAGLPGVHASIWIGMLVPAETPRPIVATLSKFINEALKAEDVTRQLRVQGMEVLGGSPEAFEQRIKKDTAGWDAVLQASGAGR